MKCLRCKNTLTQDYRRGEVYCPNCGVVVEENIISLDYDWTSHSSEEYQSKCHQGPLYNPFDPIHGKEVGSKIFYSGISDYKGRRLVEINRLRSSPSRRWKERSTAYAVQEIKRIVNNLALPPYIASLAFYLYKLSDKKNILKTGRSIDSVVSGSVYAACKLSSIPKPFKEIVRTSKSPERKIKKSYAIMKKQLKLYNNIKPISIECYLRRLCKEKSLGKLIEEESCKLLQEYNLDYRLQGHNPMVIVASILYSTAFLKNINNHSPFTQSELAEMCQVSEKSLRDNYKIIIDIVEKDS